MDVSKFKQARERIRHRGKFLHFVDKAGWEYIRRSNCTDIVIVAAVTRAGEVIFVEQYRPPVGRYVIEFPAGLINDRPGAAHESLKAGAKRELEEETGYRARRMTLLTKGPVSAGSSANLVTLLLAEGLTKVGDGGGDASEDIVTYLVPLAGVDAWLNRQARRGRLIEPKIYTGLYFLKSYNTPFR
ncbi:MAG: NUDIX hydrolase [Candidatus Omnitrophica bacterium]|nr:NUDIX hydrolase [Candidatus Omnitrophota bacterium]